MKKIIFEKIKKKKVDRTNNVRMQSQYRNSPVKKTEKKQLESDEHKELRIFRFNKKKINM